MSHGPFLSRHVVGNHRYVMRNPDKLRHLR